jgi:hypothetical protein
MSSSQRSASLDNLVVQVAALTQQANTLTGTHRALDAHLMGMQARVDAHAARLDSLERVTFARWAAPLAARLRWLVLGT